MNLASNLTSPQERTEQFTRVFFPIINYLTSEDVKKYYNDPSLFHEYFNNKCMSCHGIMCSLDALQELSAHLSCLSAMFEAIFTTSEYLVISESAFQVLGEPLAFLFNTVCFLLVGDGNANPALACWRCVTLKEASCVTCTGQVPLQSTRLFTLFSALCVASFNLLHSSEFGSTFSAVRNRPQMPSPPSSPRRCSSSRLCFVSPCSPRSFEILWSPSTSLPAVSGMGPR